MAKKTITVEVELCGLEFILTGNYYPATMDTREQPGDPAEFEIDGAELYGADAMELIETYLYEDIQEKALEEIEKDYLGDV
jgi:hypothetical protein